MDKIILAHLMIGPIILALSLLYRIKPNIIKIFGAKRLLKEEEQMIWNDAAKYSSKIMVRTSLLTLLFQLIMYFVVEGHYSIIASLVFLIIALLVVLQLTDSYLRKKFLYNKDKKSSI